ncbi:unnamed protein product [Phytomonas sp. EM1]|nr:unnamed protein product [Phytomonas sp. EM1]|eukprot:CCW61696.1 unnamed protein product [Phytomonas sp. isolate EM1]
MPPDKQYRRTKRRNKHYSPALRSYHSSSSGCSCRSNSENSEAVSYNSGSEYSSRSWASHGSHREPRRRRGRTRYSRARSHRKRYRSSSSSRSESNDDVRRGSSNSRRMHGRRYRSRSWSDGSSKSSSSSSLIPGTPDLKDRQRRRSRRHRTRRSENTGSTRRLDNINHFLREEAPKMQPPVVPDIATGKQAQVLAPKAPYPLALPPSTTVAPSSSALQMGISSSAAPREPLSPLPVYALDGTLKESTRAPVETTTPGEAANLPPPMIEDEQAYAQWLRGGRVRTPTLSMGHNTPSRIDSAVTPATGNLKTSVGASPTSAVTPTITTDWNNVQFETPFFVVTDLNALQKAPELILTRKRGGEVEPAAGTPRSNGNREVEDAPRICNKGLESESKLVNFDELDVSFKQSFMTGKVHPKPPWYLCALEKDCREHPYYIQWLDTLELSSSLEEQLARSRVRVSKIAAQGSKS